MNNNFKVSLKKLSKHYDHLFLKYGNSPKSSQVSSNQTNNVRFRILTEDILLSKNISILDFGCGIGNLYKFLNKKNFKGTYTGIDISKLQIAFAKKNIKSKRALFYHQDIFEKKLTKKYDYIFISGVFNNLISNNFKVLEKIIKTLFKNCKIMMAFNNLSYYVDYYDKGLYYVKPEKIFEFCKKNISLMVKIRHDYVIKKNTLPYEFTTFLYK
jgi:2-polyprenyl-3-methyl-5-hydroxy-6-metoxy-1,4-benzoquinol methylase